MRLVIQRVTKAAVHIHGNLHAVIGRGFVVFVGIEEEDIAEDCSWLSSKLCQMRVFSDEEGKMNLDLAQVKGELLIISQFTLHASTKKGNRPSFIKAARPEKAVPLYEQFIRECRQHLGRSVQSGEFGADMKVELVNDGPVTIVMDSKNRE